jgi:hypothetical protein
MPSAFGRAASSSIQIERGGRAAGLCVRSGARKKWRRGIGVPTGGRRFFRNRSGRSRSRPARSRVAVLHAMRMTAGRRAGRAAVAARWPPVARAGASRRMACSSPDRWCRSGGRHPDPSRPMAFWGGHAHPRLIARCSTAELHGADSMEGVEPSTSRFLSSCASGSASTGFRRRSQHQRGADHRTRSRRPQGSGPRRAASRWRPDFRRAQRSVRGDSNPPPCRV